MKIVNVIKEFFSIMSLGFFSYFSWIIVGFKKLFRLNSKSLDKLLYKIEVNKRKPGYFFLSCLFICAFVLIINISFPTETSDGIDVVRETFTQKSITDDQINRLLTDINTSTSDNVNISFNSESDDLYSIYSKINIDNVNFADLKKVNDDVVGWLSVDSTNINYPIVMGDNNKYYLNHSIDNKVNSLGWPFIDYENSIKDLDYNTIIFGNNSDNGDAFSSLDLLINNDNLNNSNYNIALLIGNKKYLFKMFSLYEVREENYYLQRYVSNKEEFISTLRARSIHDFNSSSEFKDYNNIITLTTSNKDNTKRVVLHGYLNNIKKLR